MCFKKKKEVRFEDSLRAALLAEMDLKISKADMEIQEDPFLLLGYGMNAYFDVLISLSRMMLAITLFSIPIFVIYASGTAYSD
jgi:hypothetical protein